MARREILVILACAALVYGNEAEDSEQKKRGAGKTTTLNAIPSGVQKPEYAYNIYSQSPSSSSPSGQTYQSQIPNSFYPSYGGSQYFVSGSPHTENVAPHTPQQQVNFVSPQPTSQFVPLNFIPNPGYQAKYQLAPPKSNGNIQLAIIQQPSNYASSPFLQYPQTLFSPTPTSQVNGHPNPLINSVSHGHFNFPHSYQPLSLGNPYLAQPPAMVVVPQANPLYNNLLYPNPAQSFYNYYPSNSQAKYYYGATPASSTEYEKGQGSAPQSVPKEDGEVSVQNTEYITPADASSNYKTAYSGSRGTSYTKLK